MKSITLCPSCQTQFLVTDEQLSQYGGKVRCGHCLNVFNAIDHIVVPVTENIPTEILTENKPAIEVDSSELDSNKVDSSESELDTYKVTEALETQKTAKNASPSLDDSLENSLEDSLIDNLVLPKDIPQEPTSTDVTITQIKIPETNFSTETQDASELASDTARLPDLMSENIKSVDVLNEIFTQSELPLEDILQATPKQEASVLIENATVEPDLSSDIYQEEVSKINEFDYKPEYQYFLEHKKSRSPVLITLAILFILIAILQCIYFYRDAIAMQYPESKPLLMRLCQPLGCKINLPKEIQLFSIDDSTIAEDTDHQGVIRLSSTITNRANFNQAYPNLEVTLTDTQDKPKLRRIFRPDEYLSKETQLEEGIASGDSIELEMPLMADDFKPAGFRLLVSY